MAGDLQRAFAKFDAMSPAQKRELDDTLSFLTVAQMPTEQGSKHRAMLRDQEINPQALRALGAYRAYRFKLSHQPMDDQRRAMLKLSNVPEPEIARMDSRDKWEQEQLDAFQPLMDLVKPREPQQMPAETITAAPPKPKSTRTKAKPEPKPEGESPPVAAPAPVMPAPPVAPAIQPEGQMPLIAAPPQQLQQDERLPLGSSLGGGYV